MIFEKIGQKRIENVGFFNFDEMGSRGVVGGEWGRCAKRLCQRILTQSLKVGIYEVKLGVGGKSPHTPVVVDALICCMP